MMPPIRRRFRILTFAFATLQLAAFATAPVLEGVSTSRAAATITMVGRPDASPTPIGHSPDLCPACQMMGISARLATPAAAPLLPSLRASIPTVAASAAAPAPARRGFLSRAPPTLPA